MKLHRINADHWQIIATASRSIVTIGKASTAGQLNAAASTLGLTCAELGQVITVICDREPHRVARLYGIHYADHQIAPMAQLMRALRLARSGHTDDD